MQACPLLLVPAANIDIVFTVCEGKEGTVLFYWSLKIYNPVSCLDGCSNLHFMRKSFPKVQSVTAKSCASMTSLRHRHETDVIQHLFLWIYRQSHVKGRITQQGFRCTTTENSRVHSRSTLSPKERSYCCTRLVLLIWSSATDAIIKPTLPNSDRSHLPIHMQISNSNMSASHLSPLPVYSSKARWCLVVYFVCHVPDISNHFKNAGFEVLGGPKITDSYWRYPGRIMKVFYLERAL